MTARNSNNIEEFDEIEIGPDMPLFTTSVVCSILGIPVWVLKQLDTEGIVSPPRKTEKASRFYSKRELKKVQHCWYYMETHRVNVNGLKVILQMEQGTFEGP